jgi:hypothetical protein
MSESKLTPLPGTAADGSWRIADIDHDGSDGRLAICAIVSRSSSAPLSLIGAGEGTLIGTGFYLLPNGGFATAKHVALEALEAMSRSENSVGLVYTLTNGLLVFRPIWSFAVHPTADLAFGVPHEIIDNKTGKAFRAKVLSLECAAPAIGARISTWAYPLHSKLRQPDGTEILLTQPAFYDGILQEVYAERGPSGRLSPPYYLTNIHLHGNSSGGPVFNENGHVFGVASCSYDGAEDVAFVTPIDSVFEIEVRNVDLNDGRGSRVATVREIGDAGRIAIQFR